MACGWIPYSGVLRRFAHHQRADGWWSREVGIPKSSTSNLLLALSEARLITRQGTEFTLGRKLVELGAAYLSRLDEVQKFYRYCEPGPTLSGETVRIAMLDGLNVIYLAR